MVVLTLIVAGSSTAQDTRKYRVTAYKNGNNGISSLSNTVEVVPYMNIYLPNSFTPNGDGLNDTFIPKMNGIVEFNLQVFNLWGERIFEATGIESKGWDGTYKGQLIPAGNYIYRIDYVNWEGIKKSASGSISLIR